MLQCLLSSSFGFIIVYRVHCFHALVPNLHQICTLNCGRPFGCLINASLDATCDQEQVFSPWGSREPSVSGLVSFQGTGASCEEETDLQKANVQNEWEGLAGYGRRRDMTKPRLAYAV